MLLLICVCVGGDEQRNLGMGNVKVPYDVPAAEKIRDALAKAMYEKLFLWIVRKLNEGLTGLSSKKDGGGARNKVQRVLL